MKDELWMRTWNDGHPRFSDDLHRGLLWLAAPLRRIGASIKRPAAPAEPVPLPAAQRDAA
ncbi:MULTISPECIES: hypothetical protein [unclassified Sphingopyxis]|jgi:hypothetical protein|uniref:hypothetical protein n=1 Tax=unclassified Sphingopyxis TaxID=2614943 RepID=UPI00285C0247|nr:MULTISPECIES: hypothetical protein [unclassified Sphingopyxis]MDR6832951.1 hypothetical protein [Sphingopyxis sp. BE122]MDR7228694.1 hypothetical protein [Sphingopyxis sp. BE259]